MALIKCPECNKKISSKVLACPNCGYPMEIDEDEEEVEHEEINFESYWENRKGIDDYKYEQYSNKNYNDVAEDYDCVYLAGFGSVFSSLLIFGDKKTRLPLDFVLLNNKITPGKNFVDATLDSDIKGVQKFSILGGIAGGLVSGNSLGTLYGGLTVGAEDHASASINLYVDEYPHRAVEYRINIATDTNLASAKGRRISSELQYIAKTMQEVAQRSNALDKTTQINRLNEVQKRRGIRILRQMTDDIKKSEKKKKWDIINSWPATIGFLAVSSLLAFGTSFENIFFILIFLVADIKLLIKILSHDFIKL